jgi:FemAB-related protein (PEP-CTERM system-associated)
LYSVRQLDAASAAAWDDFVRACPQAGFFHLSGWKRVIEGQFAQPCHFLLAERDGAIRGVLPLVQVNSRLFGNRLVSTGWCVGGGTAVSEPAAAPALERVALDLLDRLPVDYWEIRDPPSCHAGADWVRRDGLYAAFEGPLAADHDATLKQIPRKQRAVVRKALESGIEDRLDADVETFYRLYALSMRNLGTPVFSAGYIRALKREFADACDVVTVYEGQRPLSSVLNFYFRDRVMPYYTGADPLARGAADLMYFRVMRRAAERGFSRFDFGRSKLDTGPYAFKKNWGFTPRPVVHEYRLKAGRALPDLNPNNPKYRRMIAAWKRLPLAVANRLGPWLGRQVG